MVKERIGMASIDALGREAGEFSFSDDKSKLDVETIHAFLSRSYWAAGIPMEAVRTMIANSFCSGAYSREAGQVGFASVLTDYARFAFLADVFVLEAQRGKGLGKLLVKTALNHAALGSAGVWLLVTRDAHGLYAKFGFQGLAEPEKFMILRRRGSGGQLRDRSA
jgi:GNAT superfamily N-acetyltransferase